MKQKEELIHAKDYYLKKYHNTTMEMIQASLISSFNGIALNNDTYPIIIDLNKINAFKFSPDAIKEEAVNIFKTKLKHNSWSVLTWSKDYKLNIQPSKTITDRYDAVEHIEKDLTKYLGDINNAKKG